MRNGAFARSNVRLKYVDSVEPEGAALSPFAAGSDEFVGLISQSSASPLLDNPSGLRLRVVDRDEKAIPGGNAKGGHAGMATSAVGLCDLGKRRRSSSTKRRRDARRRWRSYRRRCWPAACEKERSAVSTGWYRCGNGRCCSDRDDRGGAVASGREPAGTLFWT
jgi:hypothetical protein